jgi:hypothetical protein
MFVELAQRPEISQFRVSDRELHVAELFVLSAHLAE